MSCHALQYSTVIISADQVYRVPTKAPWQASTAGCIVGMTSILSWRSPHTGSPVAQQRQPIAGSTVRPQHAKAQA